MWSPTFAPISARASGETQLTLGLLNDHRGAELAFGTCIALKPDYARGHEQRAGLLTVEIFQFLQS